MGALVTALLFHLGRWAIGLYLGRATQPTAYGAAASFAALLLWLYYSAQIFLFGAEFTACLGQSRKPPPLAAGSSALDGWNLPNATPRSQPRPVPLTAPARLRPWSRPVRRPTSPRRLVPRRWRSCQRFLDVLHAGEFAGGHS